MSTKWLGVLWLISSLGLMGCNSSEGGSHIGGSDPEQVQLPPIRVNLPPSPSFQKEHPAEQYSDGTYSIYGVRKNMKQTLDTSQKIKGFIIEVYECPPCPKGSTCKACDKPHFWLADRANAQKEEAMMVVDYPMEDPQTRKKTTFETGAQYIVGGNFSKTSGTGFSASDGLLVYSEATPVID